MISDTGPVWNGKIVTEDTAVSRTVAIAAVDAVLTGARDASIDVTPMLERSGISPALLGDPTARISVSSWARLVRAASEAMNDESVGLLERSMPIGTLLMLCRSFIHCKTVGEGMTRFVQFYNLLRTGLTYDLEIVKRNAHFTCHIDRTDRIKHVIIADFSMVSFHRLFSWLANELIELESVTLTGAPPVYAAEYRTAFFETPVQYGQGCHGITFNRSFMDLPLARSENDLENYLTQFNIAIFLTLPKLGELSRLLRAYMLQVYETTQALPDLDAAADHFGMTRRAFCRSLKNERFGFREAKSKVRRDIALVYLSNSKYSVEKVAELCGFSETSAFIRAFRSWSGTTPLAYRKSTQAKFHGASTMSVQ